MPMIKLPTVLEDVARYILINNPNAKMSIVGNTIYIESDSEIKFNLEGAWERVPDEIKKMFRTKANFKKFIRMVSKPKARIVKNDVVIKKRYAKEILLRFKHEEWKKIEEWAKENNLLHLNDSGLIKHIISLVVGELE